MSNTRYKNLSTSEISFKLEARTGLFSFWLVFLDGRSYSLGLFSSLRNDRWLYSFTQLLYLHVCSAFGSTSFISQTHFVGAGCLKSHTAMMLKANLCFLFLSEGEDKGTEIKPRMRQNKKLKKNGCIKKKCYICSHFPILFLVNTAGNKK